MLGDKIKKLRKNENLTQIQLSEKLGIAQSTLGMIESNKRPAGRKTLLKISEFFNVPVDYLISENDNFNKEDELANYKSKMLEFANKHNHTFFESKLLNSFDKLNDNGKKEAIKRVSELTELSKYQKEVIEDHLIPIACHDDNLNDTEKEHMNNIIDEFFKNKK